MIAISRTLLNLDVCVKSHKRNNYRWRALPQIPPLLGNAKFDWISVKETKSTYDKQPFSIIIQGKSGRLRLKMSKRGEGELAVFRRGYRVLIHFDRGPEFGRSCETRRRRFFFLKNRRFWLKENGGVTFERLTTKKKKKINLWKKAPLPPRGGTQFFEKN